MIRFWPFSDESISNDVGSVEPQTVQPPNIKTIIQSEEIHRIAIIRKSSSSNGEEKLASYGENKSILPAKDDQAIRVRNDQRPFVAEVEIPSVRDDQASMAGNVQFPSAVYKLQPPSTANEQFQPVEKVQFQPIENVQFQPVEKVQFLPTGGDQLQATENNRFEPARGEQFQPVENNRLQAATNDQLPSVENDQRSAIQYQPLPIDEMTPEQLPYLPPVDYQIPPEGIPIDDNGYIPDEKDLKGGWGGMTMQNF